MSNYGSPGGQYPGQPSDPWQQNDPYGQPSGAPYPTSPYAGSEPYSPPAGTPGPVTPGPYGAPGGAADPTYQQDPYQAQPPYGGGQPGFNQPGFGAPAPDPYGAQPPPVWGPPTTPPKKKGNGGIIALIVVLVAVLCGGGITVAYFVTKKDTKTTASPTSGPTTAPTTANGNTATASPSDNTGGNDGNDPITQVKVGQCVTNKGTEADPDLQIVSCTKNTFKVLARFNGTTDKNKCDSVPSFSHYFTYTTSSDDTSFVLCLKQQK